MNQSQTEPEVGMAKDANVIESALKGFWERARAAVTVINQLREENHSLRERLTELEKEFMSLRSDSVEKDKEIKKLRAEHAQLLNSNDHEFFSQKEKENLKVRIRELLARINSHL